MQDWNRVREGMTVYSADGHKLGKVVRSDASGIIVEKGIFFIKDYLARHEDVAAIEEDDVRLAVNREALRELREDEVSAGSTGGRAVGAIDAPDAGIAPGSFDTATLGASTTLPDGLRVPVVEEELGDLRDEKVRVTRTPHVEQRAAEGTARREEVEVDDSRRQMRRDDDKDKLET